jgi:O-antigen/teichoic acid export membrane protein
VGVFLNCLAQVPFALVQGVGRPDLTAKLHLIELPLYLLALCWLVAMYGIEGAAIAWTVRAVGDALVLFGLARRLLPVGTSFRPQITLLLAFALVTLALATLPQGLILKGIFLFLTLMVFVGTSWYLILTPEERTLAQDYR